MLQSGAVLALDAEKNIQSYVLKENHVFKRLASIWSLTALFVVCLPMTAHATIMVAEPPDFDNLASPTDVGTIMPGIHHKNSPSKLDRLAACPGSGRAAHGMGEDWDNHTTSEAAAEGTMLHAVMAGELTDEGLSVEQDQLIA